MALEFSQYGSRYVSGKIKPEFEFKFINSKNIEQVEQELKKMGIEVKQ
jgi:hypothetical protein